MKRKKRFLPLALVFVIVFLKVIEIQGVFSESDAVLIRAAEIEDATIAVGTHLIHISAMTDELYEIAMESASASNQHNIYYKSELGKGEWFHITYAVSLEDITLPSSAVKTAEIENLWFTHHTKSDGITYDLVTKKPVNIFDISSPYESRKLPELEALQIQYEVMLENKKDDDVKEQIRLVEEFFSIQLEDAQTKRLDRILEGLQQCYQAFRVRQTLTPVSEMILKMQSKADAQRRILVFQKLKEKMDTLLSLASGADIASNDFSDYEEIKVNSELIGAIGESIAKIGESLLIYEGKSIQDADNSENAMQKTESLLQEKVLQAAEHMDGMEGTAYDICETAAAQLVALENIISGKSNDAEVERELLNSMLIPRAKEYLKDGMEQGADANTINTYQEELGFYMDALCDLLPNQEAQELIRKEKEGEFGELLEKRLSDRLRQLIKEDGTSEINKLLVEKQALYLEYMEALDHDDLKAAKEHSEFLLQKEEEIEKLQEQLLKQAREQGTLDEVAAKLSDQSMAANILTWKSDALDIVEKEESAAEEMKRLEEILDALGSVIDENFPAAFPAVKDIHNAMVRERDVNDKQDYDSCIEKVEELILNNKAAYDLALQQELTLEKLDALLIDYLTDASSKEQAAVILALTLYAKESGSQVCKEKAAELARIQNGKGNPVLVSIVSEMGRVYIPVSVIAEYTGMRYVWNNHEKKATLAKGSSYITFLAFSNQVQIGKGEEIEQMENAAKFKGEIYLPDRYVSDNFAIAAVVIEGSDYAIVYDSKLEEMAQQFKTELAMEGEP